MQAREPWWTCLSCIPPPNDGADADANLPANRSPPIYNSMGRLGIIPTGLRIGNKAIGSLRKPNQVPVRMTLRCRSDAFSPGQLLYSGLAFLPEDLFSCSAAYYEVDHGFRQLPEHRTKDGRIERHG
jgi:hypothetical protein